MLLQVSAQLMVTSALILATLVCALSKLGKWRLDGVWWRGQRLAGPPEARIPKSTSSHVSKSTYHRSPSQGSSRRRCRSMTIPSEPSSGRCGEWGNRSLGGSVFPPKGVSRYKSIPWAQVVPLLHWADWTDCP